MSSFLFIGRLADKPWCRMHGETIVTTSWHEVSSPRMYQPT
jgi:hypothetical protein